ncbi:MAG: FAD-dependent oxidoreductase [Conexibacter sp.]|nr:FAD-dependent oxidoreductase [Conexibacter sp.]
MRPTRVVIVGGGVAGLTAAYYLRRGGAEVTVLERRRVGGGASGANAGWIAPAQAGPLPEPGLAAYGARSLTDRESALYVAPTQLPRMASWLIRFALRCNARDHRRGTQALGQLGRRAFELVEQLADDGVELELHRLGFVVAGRQRAGVEAFLAGRAPLRELGLQVPDRVLEAAELHELEPALADAVTSGVLVEQHWHVHAPQLMAALARRLREQGVVLEEGAEALDLARGADGRVREVRSSAGAHPADAVVLAAGAWSPALARGLGVRLPVAAGKGYSFEVALPQQPRHALLLLEPHVGASPLRDRVRIAGTMEFSGVGDGIDRRRVETIARGARQMLRGFDAQPLEDVRGGMRPIAPDGLPIVDRAPGHENVFLATAYSMLGITIGAPAGEALARMILSGERPAELEPFRATRFGWRTR